MKMAVAFSVINLTCGSVIDLNDFRF